MIPCFILFGRMDHVSRFAISVSCAVSAIYRGGLSGRSAALRLTLTSQLALRLGDQLVILGQQLFLFGHQRGPLTRPHGHLKDLLTENLTTAFGVGLLNRFRLP